MSVALVSLGCPKNLVDSERILGALDAAGVSITSERTSDVVIINTCAFIKPAIEETRAEIRRALRNSRKVYVFGCAVNRLGEELKSSFPKVSGWYRLAEEADLLKAVKKNARPNHCRLVTTSGYAFLKIAEGCSNNCTYCTVPLIRGRYQSAALESLLKEARALASAGIRELILCGQDTTSYGLDLYRRLMLVPLIKELSRISGISWIRILYAHPRSVTEELIDQIKDNPKVCKYLDLPIQHINDRILKLMNRGVKKRDIVTLIKSLKKIKGISLRTTVIAGFPSETRDEFKELINFVKGNEFDWLGVFPYFCEPGTRAAVMPQLSHEIVRQRTDQIIKVQQDLIRKRNRTRINKIYQTLITGRNRYFIGHTQFATPDIDCRVMIRNKDLQIGDFYDVRIDRCQGVDLYGGLVRRGYCGQ